MSGPPTTLAARSAPYAPATPTYPSGAIAVRAEKGFARAEALLTPGRCPRCFNQWTAPVMVCDPDFPDAPPKERMGRCRCQRTPDQCRNFSAAQIPARYGTYSFGSWRPQPLQQAVYQTEILPWLTTIENTHPDDLLTAPGLVLWGQPGRGKTHLAVGLLRRLCLEAEGRLRRIRYVEPNQIIQTMKAFQSSQQEDQRSNMPMSKLVDVDVLLIDDLILPRTDFERSVLDELLTRRWQRGGPTLVTTNLTEAELHGTLSPRVVSRLSEAKWLALPGADFRNPENRRKAA